MAPDANLNPNIAATEPHAGQHSLLQRFEYFAAATPHASALESNGEQLTYAQLNSRANQLVYALTKLGISRRDLVVLCLPASTDCVAAMLAVVKSGAAFVPVDAAWPQARIDGLMRQVKPKLMIHAQEDAASDWGQQTHIHIDDLINRVERNPAVMQNPDILIEADDLCYVMHTSGTTGQPKGAMISHRNLQALFSGAPLDFTSSSRDKWSWLHSLAFGYSAWEIWGAFWHGACLVIVPDEIRKDPAAWSRLLAESGVTMLSLTPSALRQLAELASTPNDFPGNVRIVFLSGEAVRHDDLERWRTLFGDSPARLINLYALTETAGRIAIKELSGNETVADSLIGEPVADAELFIVDPGDLSLQDEGELLIAGPMLSKGYLGDPDLTAQRFIEFDPGDHIPRRCYRSGDRARVNESGELEFLGRVDQQLKIRGYRVEPGDIETALRAHSGVADVAVIMHESAAGSDQLTAFLVANQPAEATLEFWPSLGEHLLYDELLYDFMAADQVRIASYQQAFSHAVKDKVVLDIGTGKHAVLARMCAAAGARKVYAVELLPEAAQSARELVAELGLSNQIEVICGDMQSISLPEPIDVCTQGVVGNIGSSDGIASLWNAARQWFASDVVAIPERCTTLIAPGELPAVVRDSPAYTPLAREYLERLYAAAGHQFDPRLCVRNFSPEQLLATEAVFEHLDFRALLQTDYQGQCEFVVRRAGHFDGLLLWTRLLNQHAATVDFFEHQQAWLPVWLPVAEHGVTVEAGDRIVAEWSCHTSSDSVFPDYVITAVLWRAGHEVARLQFASPHQSRFFRQTDLHRSLADNPARQAGPDAASLHAMAGSQLPAHMVPTRWELIDRLPLNSSGKLDRHKLASLVETATHPASLASPADRLADSNDVLEKEVTAIWSNVLGRDIGPEADFFDAGGDSILAVRLTTEIQRYLDDTVFLAALFDAPTVAEYTKWLKANHADAVARRLETIERPEPVAANDARPAALSHAQQSLWFLQQLYPESTAANEQFLIRMNQHVDADKIIDAWSALMARHNILRTVFTEQGGVPQQFVTEEGSRLAAPRDWSRLSDGDAEAKVLELARAEMTTGFDLSKGPLLRPHLLFIPQDATIILVTAHHIIADGLTVPIFARELAALYHDAPAELAAPTLQFSDYVQWEKTRLKPELVASESDWWRNHLHGASEMPLLPAAQSASRRPRASRYTVHVPAQVAQRLRDVARAERASTFMLLLATWRTWLSRCLDADDLLIGTPMTLRKDAATAAMPGCMVNNIALRNALRPDMTFRDVLRSERSNLLEEWEHSVLPFDRVVEAVQPERVMGRHPLFQSMFFFSERSPAIDGFSTDVLAVARDSFWDLDITVTDHGVASGFELVLSVRDDLVDVSRSSQWPQGFLRMLGTIADDADVCLLDLPLAGSDEIDQSPWTALNLPTDDGAGLYGLVALQAARAPAAVAIVDGQQTLNYGELIEQADAFCAALQAAGIVHGDVVGVAAERSAQTIALLLGINRAGATWLALDPTWPAERLRSMLADAEPGLIVANENVSALAAEAVGYRQATLDELARVGPDGGNLISIPAQPNSDAFILFTSGSTGKPKGVALPLAGIINRCLWMWREYGFSVDARFAQRSSLNFVDSAWEIFGPLLHGARLVVMPHALAADPAGQVDWLSKHEVSHLVTVPILLDALLREGLEDVSCLQSVVTSGETLLPELLQRFQRQLPDCQLFNTYGASEFWDATCSRVDQLDASQLERVPIGHAIPNMACRILNASGQSVPAGFPGELCVTGINVATGYLANPALSGQKFVTAADGTVLYRTGDRAIRGADGSIELLGRADRQFKINGIRVEATDIEANAMACPDVGHAALIAATDIGFVPPVLFAIAAEHAALSAEALRHFLSQRLPRALVPAEIRILDQWPTTPSGKNDLRALGKLVQARDNVVAFVAPRNATEQIVADIWAEVLGIAEVSALDDFFALGGHSLLATRVIARLAELCEVDLPLQSLFEQRTVAEIADSIIALRSLAGQSASVARDAEQREVFRL